MRKIILILCFLSLNLSAQITVNGNNFNNLIDARNYVRTINQNMTSDIIVNIAPGTYILDQTLEFSNEDSGTGDFNIIYQAADPNNKPIISGGQQITGWTPYDTTKNIWKANIGNLYSRQLYVNGERAIRARSEDNFGLYETKTGYVSTCTDFSNWENVKDIEIVSNIRWRHCRIPVESICNNNIFINNEYWQYIHNANSGELFKRYPPDRLENALELLNEENEWYIKKNETGNILYYKPINGTNIENLEIIIPKLEKLIEGYNCNNIVFQNIYFNYTKWNKPSLTGSINGNNNGFWPFQADNIHDIESITDFNENEIPGSLSFSYATKISFKKCHFSKIGSTALVFLIGCQNNEIIENTFTEIAASGIRIGDYSNTYNPCLNPLQYSDSNPCPITIVTCNEPFLSTEQPKLVQNHTVCKNVLNNIGTEYLSSCPILVTFARNTLINYNTITSFPYSGISLGWGFSKGVNHGLNSINNNYIDCSNQVIPDGGAIYTLSSHHDAFGNHSKISNNYIQNQKFYRAAIYLDHSSSYIDVENNLIDSNFSSLNTNHECIEENIKFVDCWYNSQNVNIINNHFNSLYLNPLNPNDPSAQGSLNMLICHSSPCIQGIANPEYNSHFPNCNDVVLSNNIHFSTYNSYNSTQNQIKNNAGANAPNSNNCN